MRARFRNSPALPMAVAAGCVAAVATVTTAVQLIDATAGTGIEFTQANSPTQSKYLPETMGGGVALFDYDNDGRLDIFFVNGASIKDPMPPGGMPDKSDRKFWNRLYRQNPDGTFTDVTEKAGLTGLPQNRYGMGVAVGDFDNDGFEDIYVTGFGGNTLYHNNGNGTFSDVTARAGVEAGGWSTSAGFLDYDNDGKLDLLVATFQNEPKALYHNDGNGLFSDLSMPSGLGSVTAPFVAFGCKFFDYDNDGLLDLILANGHVQDNIQAINRSVTYRQPTQLMHNEGGSPVTFRDASASSGPDLQRPIVGRGLAVGDYDNDGKLDVLVVDAEGKPLLLHNQVARAGNWLGVKLIGTRSNRDGYGARLTAQFGGRSLLRQCQSCGSYLSASDRRVHFGLGAATSVDTLTVEWPSHTVSVYHNVRANRYITIREGDLRVLAR